jgi:hypothetical protein
LSASVRDISSVGVEEYEMSRRYTGVIDINGRKIYTGDIVEMHYFWEVRSLQGAYVEERYVVGRVGGCWGKFYTEQEIGEQRRYYWDKYLEEPHEELVVVKYNPCYHCTDGLYDRCAMGMCKYKWEPWKGSVDALTIDVCEGEQND